MGEQQPDLNIEKRERKVREVIWLPITTFLKVLETAQKLGVAENVVCVEMIKRYLEKGEPIKEIVVEKTVSVGSDRFVCPYCFEDFVGRVAKLKEHLREKHAAEIAGSQEGR